MMRKFNYARKIMFVFVLLLLSLLVGCVDIFNIGFRDNYSGFKKKVSEPIVFNTSDTGPWSYALRYKKDETLNDTYMYLYKEFIIVELEDVFILNTMTKVMYQYQNESLTELKTLKDDTLPTFIKELETMQTIHFFEIDYLINDIVNALINENHPDIKYLEQCVNKNPNCQSMSIKVEKLSEFPLLDKALKEVITAYDYKLVDQIHITLDSINVINVDDIRGEDENQGKTIYLYKQQNKESNRELIKSLIDTLF